MSSTNMQIFYEADALRKTSIKSGLHTLDTIADLDRAIELYQMAGFNNYAEKYVDRACNARRLIEISYMD